MADDAIEVHRVPPGDDGVGAMICTTCGHRWPTTPEEDRLLAAIFEHQATHRARRGAAPSSVDPPISTR
jgi:hypothetical protein